MRWFEQGTSNARCIITQFHRPAELKLKRMCRRISSPVCLPNIREFLFLDKEMTRRGSIWKVQKNYKTMDLGLLRAHPSVAFYAVYLLGHRFVGILAKAMAFLCPFLESNAL